jgi:protein O-GlcNAc transferase
LLAGPLKWLRIAPRLRQYIEAIAACLQAIDIEPFYAEAHAYLAEAYIDDGRWERALETARYAVELDGASVDVLRNLGYVLEMQGRYDEAIAAYQEAISLHPRLAFLYVHVGRNYRVLGDMEAAIHQFEQAAAADPGDAEARDELGWTYYQLGEHERAMSALEQALEVDPTYVSAHGHLGMIYYTRRNYEGAIERFQRAIDLGGDKAEYCYYLGLCHAYLEDCDQARFWLTKTLEIDPQSSLALQALELCPSP